MPEPNSIAVIGMEMPAYTKYEKTKIIASRALQIAQGSPVFIKAPKGITDPIKIAELEWNENAIPIRIKHRKPVK